jgi:hypothetical protein
MGLIRHNRSPRELGELLLTAGVQVSKTAVVKLKLRMMCAVTPSTVDCTNDSVVVASVDDSSYKHDDDNDSDGPFQAVKSGDLIIPGWNYGRALRF